jgi:hypothetical protein
VEATAAAGRGKRGKKEKMAAQEDNGDDEEEVETKVKKERVKEVKADPEETDDEGGYHGKLVV